MPLLVKRVTSAQSSVEDTLPYYLMVNLQDRDSLLEIALTNDDYQSYLFAVSNDAMLFERLALKVSSN